MNFLQISILAISMIAISLVNAAPYDDQPLDLDLALVSGSYIPRFKAPTERNPTYQGENPQY